MLASVVTLALLATAVGYSVFFKAGVYTADEAVTFVGVGAVSLFYWLTARRGQTAPALPRWMQITLVAIPCYLTFQLIPLSLGMLQILSPERAQLTRAVEQANPAVHAAPLSVNMPISALQLFTVLCCISIFLLMRELAWRFSHRPWLPVIPLIVIAVFEAGVGMFQTFAGAAGAQASGTYTNRDHFSGMLEMVLPLAAVYGIAILRGTRSRYDSPALPALGACVLWSASALILLGIIYSLSRMGFVDALCVLFVIAALTIGPRLPSRKWRWSSIGVIGLVVAAMLIALPPSELIARFASLSSEGRGMADDRLSFWRDTWPVIREYRWFGSGLGSFESVYLKHQTTALNMTVQFAHNDYLQHLAEMGVAGFTLVVAFVAGVCWQLFRGIVKLADEDRRLIAVACAGSFVAIGLHSMVDFNLYIPANEMVLSWIAGIGSLNGLD
jgi:O-antigen ligase